MKNKKNGFTFVELLGVITIIGILSLIAVPTIEKIVKENKEQIYQKQLDNIVLSLKNWASDNRKFLPEKDGEELTITLSNLKADGYIEYDVKNPKTNKCFDNEMLLKIVNESGNYTYSIDVKTIKESETCEFNPDAPIIILKGNSVENIEINDIYVDKGVTAVDKDGNDITNNVVTVITGSGSSIDTSKLSNQYVINYTVSANGKTSTISRTVKIVDTPAPVINISSNVALTVSDTTFDLMNGVEVTDNSGETIEASVKSNITFGLPGTYTITYTAADSSGNKTIKHRILTITGTL